MSYLPYTHEKGLTGEDDPQTLSTQVIKQTNLWKCVIKLSVQYIKYKKNKIKQKIKWDGKSDFSAGIELNVFPTLLLGGGGGSPSIKILFLGVCALNCASRLNG